MNRVSSQYTENSLKMKMLNPSVPVILSSAYPGYKCDPGAWASDDYVVKPGNLKNLKLAIQKLLKE